MRGFYSCHKTDKKFKSLYGFGGRCLKIRDVRLDFEVIYQKRVRVFHQGFQPTNESTRPQAECFYYFEVFGTPDETRSTSF